MCAVFLLFIACGESNDALDDDDDDDELFSIASNGLGERRTRYLSFAGSNFHHSTITARSCQMQNALGNATPVFSPNSVT